MTSRVTAADVSILDAKRPADRQRWLDAWQAWPAREVFAHPSYVSLYAGADARARCALLASPRSTVMYPFLQRDLPSELGADAPACDLTTPYGYGGPFVWGADAPYALAAPFWDGFEAWCACEGVVSEFVRFALGADAMLPFPGTTEERALNVVRSLDLPPEALWMDVQHKVRKNVKRAQQSGVTVETDETGERLSTFLKIYEATMDRRDAGAQYYFTRSYFEAIHRDLPGQFLYVYAMHEGHAVSTELVLVSETALYSFLGGTLRDAFAVRPNDLLKYEIMRWGQDHGKRAFVLGGGYQPDDGIYRYKTSFAPDGQVPFRVGTRIHDAARYAALVERRRALAADDWTPARSFFPAYRG